MLDDIPTVNILDDGALIRVRSQNVEVIVYSQDGNINIKHENGTSMIYTTKDDKNEKLTTMVQIER